MERSAGACPNGTPARRPKATDTAGILASAAAAPMSNQARAVGRAAMMKSLTAEFISAFLQALLEGKTLSARDVAVSAGSGLAAGQIVKHGSRVAVAAADATFSRLNRLELPLARLTLPPLKSREQRRAEWKPDPLLVRELTNLRQGPVRTSKVEDHSGWSSARSARIQAM